MPNLTSAKKRAKQDEQRRIRNRARKAVVKTESRKFFDMLHEGNLDGAKAAFPNVTKKLDQVAAKGTLHKNTVARRKSRLARALNAALAAKKD